MRIIRRVYIVFYIIGKENNTLRLIHCGGCDNELLDFEGDTLENHLAFPVSFFPAHIDRQDVLVIIIGTQINAHESVYT